MHNQQLNYLYILTPALNATNDVILTQSAFFQSITMFD